MFDLSTAFRIRERKRKAQDELNAQQADDPYNTNAGIVPPPVGVADNDADVHGDATADEKYNPYPSPQVPPAAPADTSSGIGYNPTTAMPQDDDVAPVMQPSARGAGPMSGARVSPRDTQTQLYQQEQDLAAKPVKDKNGRLMTGVHALLDSLAAGYQPGRVGDEWNSLLGYLAHAGGSFAGGTLDKTYDERKDKVRDLAKIREQEDMVGRQIKTTQDQAQRDATTQNIYDDNTRQADRNKDLKDIADNKILVSKLKNFTDRIWKGQKYFDPSTATELDKRELAGLNMKPEDVGKFDFRDPKTKIVNDVTFQWDANSQSFSESNLPKDGSKELVTYNVKDPDGVDHTFTVTSDRAAGFLTSIKAAGMQIDAAAARQSSQQAFQGAQNAADRAIRMQSITQAAQQFKAKNSQEVAEKLAGIQKQVTIGAITQAEADNLIGVIKQGNPGY